MIERLSQYTLLNLILTVFLFIHNICSLSSLALSNQLEILDLQSLIEKEKLSQLRLRESRIPPSVSSYPAYDSPYGSGSRRRSISPVRTGARGYPEDPRSAYPPPPPAAIPMAQVTPDRYGRLASAPREEYGHYSARDRDAFGAKESGRYDDYSRRG